MNRVLLATTIAALGLTLLATAQIQANGPQGNGSGHPTVGSNHQGAMSGRRGEAGRSFKANERFDYRRHGFRSLSWTRYGWSDRYHHYLYWEPRYGWCFYEPTYTSYLPIAYYPEVYPQSTLTAAPEVIPGPVVSTVPSVIQQTTVALAAPVAPAVDLPTPPLAPRVPPAPGAVQQTKVGAGVP
ncbi:MAG TPA: hypothetical protein VGP68_10755 [Gemmataceae bacterium]|jgi:hypothetical protein|nr:hypothetical protein [Gemmataceae bacterium]